MLALEWPFVSQSSLRIIDHRLFLSMLLEEVEEQYLLLDLISGLCLTLLLEPFLVGVEKLFVSFG